MRTITSRILMGVVAVAAALSASGCASSPISISGTDETAPAIHRLSVVWEDARNAETNGSDIYTRDIGGTSDRLVAGGAGDQEQPTISDRYIAWIDNGRLRALDRTTGTTFNVTSGPATQADPSLCGTVIAWTDSRSGSPDIYVRDLAGGPEIAAAASAAAEAYPACDAGRVVYMYAPAGEWASIRLFNVSSRSTTVVSQRPWNQWRPAISADRVVWQAWPNQPDTATGIQIMGERLSTGDTFTVTDGPGNQTGPTISGTAVAWEDFRSGEMRVWWRDLSSGTGESEVDSNQLGRQQAPALNTGTRWLVDQSDQFGAWNVFTVALASQT